MTEKVEVAEREREIERERESGHASDIDVGNYESVISVFSVSFSC